MMKEKIFTIKAERPKGGRFSGNVITNYYTGTLDYLINNVFGYTLEVGESWQHEKGNKKINRTPKTPEQLARNLYNAKNNAARDGYSGYNYTVVPNEENPDYNPIPIKESVDFEGRKIKAYVLPVGVINILTGKTMHDWSIYEQPDAVAFLVKPIGFLLIGNKNTFRIGEEVALISNDTNRKLGKTGKIIDSAPCIKEEVLSMLLKNGFDYYPKPPFQKAKFNNKLITSYSVKGTQLDESFRLSEQMNNKFKIQILRRMLKEAEESLRKPSSEDKLYRKWKTFEEVQKGDIGEDYHGEKVKIYDKGIIKELCEKYPNSPSGLSDFISFGIKRDDKGVVIKVNPRDSFESFGYEIYTFGDGGVDVFMNQEQFKSKKSKVIGDRMQEAIYSKSSPKTKKHNKGRVSVIKENSSLGSEIEKYIPQEIKNYKYPSFRKLLINHDHRDFITIDDFFDTVDEEDWYDEFNTWCLIHNFRIDYDAASNTYIIRNVGAGI